jgi:hypothetical protein
MYMSKKSYAEQIRIPTDKAQDNAIDKKHSEFKKPYLSDDYEEMEYFADAPPGYAFDPFNFDTEWMGTPIPDFGDSVPWSLIFFCTLESGDCYCEGTERCFSLKCNHEITGVDINSKGFDVTVSKSTVCVTAPEGKTGSVEIDVHMRAPEPGRSGSFVYGTHSDISLSPCKEKDCCITDAAMAWDAGNSDSTIATGGSAALAITGNNGPFTWAVSSSDFSLAYTETEGLENTLYANNDIECAVVCGILEYEVVWSDYPSAGCRGELHLMNVFLSETDAKDARDAYTVAGSTTSDNVLGSPEMFEPPRDNFLSFSREKVYDVECTEGGDALYEERWFWAYGIDDCCSNEPVIITVTGCDGNSVQGSLTVP